MTLVIPYCQQCKVAVPDTSDNHHVCAPDGAGGFTVTTRDAARSEWETGIAAAVLLAEETAPEH